MSNNINTTRLKEFFILEDMEAIKVKSLGDNLALLSIKGDIKIEMALKNNAEWWKKIFGHMYSWSDFVGAGS